MATGRLMELFEQAQSAAQSYSRQADQLSDSIEAFEKLLDNLCVKVEVEVDHDGPDGKYLAIRYHRSGNGWGLDVATYRAEKTGILEVGPSVRFTGFDIPRPSLVGRWTALTSAALEKKIRAISLFEKLLVQLVNTHQLRNAEVHSALASLKPLIGKAKTLTEEEK